MRALLDTHAFLWWAADDARLSFTAREVIQNPDNVLFFSVVSAWEIIIKYTINKLPLPEPPQTYIPSRVAYYENFLLKCPMFLNWQIYRDTIKIRLTAFLSLRVRQKIFPLLQWMKNSLSILSPSSGEGCVQKYLVKLKGDPLGDRYSIGLLYKDINLAIITVK